jgi:hypothetical protein
MKLLNTIQQLINEAEDNLYNASLKSDSVKEIESLENKLDDTIKLFYKFRNLS